ncbi:hypothetical protein, partial [Pseudovibrio flavus]|uniref:hypothetical protein n=1 Tax=Pseudovibrio flavus TaxID=2529854 RepID=UPI00211C9BCA
VAFEGDVEVGYTNNIDQSGNTPTIVLTETDSGTDPLLVNLGDYFTATPTDADGSENITGYDFQINNLPTGTLFSTDGGVTFSSADISGGTLNYSGNEPDLSQLVLALPADFSTQNPQTTIDGTFTAKTDEGGSASQPFGIYVAYESDIELTAPAAQNAEDANNNTVDLGISAAITDLDLSEGDDNTADTVSITFGRLPAGTTANVGALDVGNLTWTGTAAEASQLALTFPEDFSTQSSPDGTPEAPIDYTITVTTSEGTESVDSSITVTPTEDIDIDAKDVTVNEDSGPIALNLGLAITDQDLSENLVEPIKITFTDLPAGASFNVGSFNPVSGEWFGTLADYQALVLSNLPEHYSGIITAEVEANSNEGADTDQFLINVLPIAEPTIDMTVIAAASDGDTQIAKEDTPFTVNLSASTPDTDGSESLTTIVLSNVPDGWVALSGGNTVDPSAFTSGGSDIQSATYDSSTGELTITFNPGLTSWNGDLTLTPANDTDKDINTLMNGELTATVTSTDTAADLPSNQASASDEVDVDVDAVIDTPDLRDQNQTVNEDLNSRGESRLRITRLRLGDTDGSETYGPLMFTITVDETASDNFSVKDSISVRSTSNGSFGDITLVSSDDGQATYTVTQPDGIPNFRFEQFVQNLRVSYPENFSGKLSIDGSLVVNETTTPTTMPGDNEYDTSDNSTMVNFDTTVTVRPRAEAELKVTLEPAQDGFNETPLNDPNAGVSVQPGDQPPNVEIFEDSSVTLKIEASTPDTDGSEELNVIRIDNIPNDWFAYAPDGTVDPAIFGAESGKIDTAVYNENNGQLTITFNSNVI